MTDKKKLLIFAGTQDGRELAEMLARNRIEVKVCVATAYGEDMIEENNYLQVSVGRLQEQEMEELLGVQSYLAVIDATHPYATEVSGNIRTACEQTGHLYIRYTRDCEKEVAGDVLLVDSTQEAAEQLNKSVGNILLTTGSKELHIFTEHIQDKERLYVRVLPSIESLQLCSQSGIDRKHIIAMQGPFSEAMNQAMLEQYHIETMVTKQTGVIGGYPDKLRAADKAGVKVVVIKNPDMEKHYQKQDLISLLESLLKQKIEHAPARELKVIGMGMGSEDTLTIAGRRALQQADVIFGAPRLIDSLDGYRTPKVTLYEKDKILTYLKEHTEYQHPVLAVSGDVGFYSGGLSFQNQKENDIHVTYLSGISSLSYFCAKLGMPWQDIHITSIHGRDANLVGKVLQYGKVFSLLSNLFELREVLEKLVQYHMGDCQVYVGYRLSYEQEEIRCLLASEASKLQDLPEKGLYVVLLEHLHIKPTLLFPSIMDGSFLRGKAPMTKSEVRDLSVAKLKLTKDAVVWDVGAGTGSVSVTCALSHESIQVYAIEWKTEAVELMEQNRRQFCADNITIVQTKAPEGLEELPTPTHAFIGGSGGQLAAILTLLWKKNPHMRIVVNIVTLETMTELMQILETLPHEEEEIVQVAVSKAEKRGAYHLMQAQNPVYIVSFTLCKS